MQISSNNAAIKVLIIIIKLMLGAFQSHTIDRVGENFHTPTLHDSEPL